MDLLHKRYASPFSFMDGMIQSGRFTDFIVNFVETINKEQEEQHSWEFYLHKVSEGSYLEFRESMETDKRNQNMSKRTIETTVQESMNILKNFTPAKGGENVNGTI